MADEMSLLLVAGNK